VVFSSESQHGWDNFINYTEALKFLDDDGSLYFTIKFDDKGIIELERIPELENHIPMRKVIYPYFFTNALLFGLLDDKETADVKFVFPSFNDYVIHSHRAILAHSSGVFKEMFFDGVEKVDIDIVTISKSDPTTFLIMLEYMYTGSIFIPFNCAVELLELAHEYEISNLQDEVQEFIGDYLTVEIVANMFQKSLVLEIEELNSASGQFIDEHAFEVFNQDAFLEMPKEAIHKLFVTYCNSDNSFIGIMQWGIYQVSKKFGLPKVLDNNKLLTINGFATEHFKELENIVGGLELPVLVNFSDISAKILLKHVKPLVKYGVISRDVYESALESRLVDTEEKTPKSTFSKEQE